MRKELIKCMCSSEELNLETNINVVGTYIQNFLVSGTTKM